MKWLGKVEDSKDLTTKEYVDKADETLRARTENAMKALDESKIDATDISEYSQAEVSLYWNRYFKS